MILSQGKGVDWRRCAARGTLPPLAAYRRRCGVQAFSRRKNLKVNWQGRPREGGLDHGMGGLCPTIFVQYGVPAKAGSFCGAVSRPGATHFCDQTKVGKNWIRTCGSKDSLLPADLPSSITGAWGSKGLLHLPRALRPPAAEHSVLSVPMRSACCGKVGQPARVRKR